MLSQLQHALVAALRTTDPRSHLLAWMATPECTLTAAARAMVEALPDDGLRLTRLLVRKLRMQRLLQADGAAGRLLASEPERFAAMFRAYDAAVPLQAVFPSEEAHAFRRWSEEARAHGELP